MVVLTRLTSKQLERLVNIARSVPLAHYGKPAQAAPRRQRRLEPAEKAKVIQAYESGDSMASLARLYGVRRETISKVIRDAGIEVRVQRAISQEQTAEAAALYLQGWSLARLAQRFGFDGQTIRTHLVRAGVAMREPHDWRRLP
jgi:transposase-like protein